MTTVVRSYTAMIPGLIRSARQLGAITRPETAFLLRMTQEGFVAASTKTLVSDKGAPDFLYAALYFSTLIWQVGNAAENDVEARAGYRLARFVLSQESPAHDSYWAAKLLQEFCSAHEEMMQNLIDDEAVPV